MNFQKDQKSDFAVLTPYLIPPVQAGRRVNIGDGFILKAVERHLGRFDPGVIMTKRIAPRADQIDRMSRHRVAILAGANQLRDNFTPWPGMTSQQFEKLDFAFVPMGIGLDGNPKRNRGFTENTLAILEKIHERIEYSSWRCPRTVELLTNAMPHLADKFLMTGCPVIYDDPLLTGLEFSKGSRKVAVTVTERDDFFDRESKTLDAVSQNFPDVQKYLVLHQDFSDRGGKLGRAVRRINPLSIEHARLKLYAHARMLGFEIVRPQDAADVLAFYEDVDLHVGSRLHAHLTFISRNKWSFLTYVDDRCIGFSEFLDFPLIQPNDLTKHLDMDFEPIRQNAQAAFETMKKFVGSLDKIA